MGQTYVLKFLMILKGGFPRYVVNEILIIVVEDSR